MSLNFELVKKLSQRDTDMAEHVMTLYQAVKNTEAKVVVELGAGQSTYALALATLETGGVFYSIDVGPKAHLRNYEEGEGLLENLPEYVGIIGDDLEVVKFWTRPIDFLLIDTTHEYEQTKRELQEWSKFVKKEGIIALHDTASIDPVSSGVRKALDEFLANGGYTALHYSDTKRIGLSILTKNQA